MEENYLNSGGRFSSSSSSNNTSGGGQMMMLNMHNMAPAAARHQLNLNHGRSQSSFRSYTNHHMGSGSNHCVTDLDEE